MATCTYVVYQIFGTADVQSWNNPDSENSAETTSMIGSVGTVDEKEKLKKDESSPTITSNSLA